MANAGLSDTAVYVVADGLSEGFGHSGGGVGTGGAASHMVTLVRGLLDLGLARVVIITDIPFEFPGVTVRAEWPGSQIPSLGVLVKRLRRRLLWLEYRGRAQAKVALYAQVLDYAHLAAAKKMGVATISMVNGNAIVDETLINKSTERVQRMLRLLPEVDAIFVLNHQMVRDVSRRFQRVAHLIPSGVYPAPPTVFGLEREYALWVGRPEPLKRPWAFIEIARRMPDRKFVMVLRSHPAYLEAIDFLRHEARELGNVEFAIDVPAPQMCEYYARAVALVSTSGSEGLPRTWLEAGAAGTEVLSFELDVDGMLSGGDWGYCAGGAWSVLDERLEDLFATSGGGPAHSDAVRRHVAATYSVEDMVNAFAEAVAEVSSRRDSKK